MKRAQVLKSEGLVYKAKTPHVETLGPGTSPLLPGNHQVFPERVVTAALPQSAEVSFEWDGGSTEHLHQSSAGSDGSVDCGCLYCLSCTQLSGESALGRQDMSAEGKGWLIRMRSGRLCVGLSWCWSWQYRTCQEWLFEQGTTVRKSSTDCIVLFLLYSINNFSDRTMKK